MKVVICGAGISGLALAGRLSALGAEVVLVERAPEPRHQGYMIDFFGPGYDAVESMGALPALETVAYHIEEASLLDENGRRRARVRYAQFAQTEDGRLLNVMRPDLEQVLRQRLPQDLEIRYGRAPVAIEERGEEVRVTLDDDTTIAADLLVGADGIHSAVRRLVFGEEQRFLRYLGFHTAAYTFDAPEVYEEVRGRFCLTDTIGRQMGFYGLRDGRVAAFAVHRSPDRTVPADSREALRNVYGDLGWVVPEALARCPRPAEIYYDQVAQVDMPSWHRGRAVLLGDAGYAVSLLAGQGASLGIAGAYVLADRLSQEPSIASALEGYEQLWRPITDEKQQVGRAAAHWFLPATTTRLLVRRAMLRLAQLPVVNRWLPAVVAGKPSTLIADLRGS